MANTKKAWLAGWDAGICGLGWNACPYRSTPHVWAWRYGWGRGRRSNDEDVRTMKRLAGYSS